MKAVFIFCTFLKSLIFIKKVYVVKKYICVKLFFVFWLNILVTPFAIGGKKRFKQSYNFCKRRNTKHRRKERKFERKRRKEQKVKKEKYSRQSTKKFKKINFDLSFAKLPVFLGFLVGNAAALKQCYTTYEDDYVKEEICCSGGLLSDYCWPETTYKKNAAVCNSLSLLSPSDDIHCDHNATLTLLKDVGPGNNQTIKAVCCVSNKDLCSGAWASTPIFITCAFVTVLNTIILTICFIRDRRREARLSNTNNGLAQVVVDPDSQLSETSNEERSQSGSDTESFISD